VEKKPTHIFSIDILRGIAALLVCLYHFSYSNLDYLHVNNILRITGQYGRLGVEIFFIISGFILPYAMYMKGYKINNSPKFLLKRIIRIEPPYIINIFLVIFLSYLSSFASLYRGPAFSIDYFNLSLHLGYLNSIFHLPSLNPVYWTLAIEFQYYLLIGLLFPIIIHKNKLLRYSALLILYAVSFLFDDTRLIFHYSLFFIIGIILFHYITKLSTTKETIIALSISLFLIFLKFNLPIILFVLFSCLMILFGNLNFSAGRIVGRISFSLYLIHIPIGMRVLNLSENFIFNEYLRSLFVFLSIGVSIVAAWVFYKLFEEPSLKLSQKIEYIEPEIKTDAYEKTIKT
jgi:peptidoglycan/LPS O-acetylase OafA/YrhL